MQSGETVRGSLLDSTNPAAATAINNKLSPRPFLLDQMLAEDSAKAMDPISPKTLETLSTLEANKPSFVISNDDLSPAIVPCKKKGGGIGFMRQLLLRRKREG